MAVALGVCGAEEVGVVRGVRRRREVEKELWGGGLAEL